MRTSNKAFLNEAIQRIYSIQGIDLSDEVELKITDLSIHNRVRLELIREQKVLQRLGYGLYMISIAYRQYDREYKYEEVSAYFDKFYHQKLLPAILGNHPHRNCKKHLWPIITLTTEQNTAHRAGKIHDGRVKNARNNPVFHHHAAIAIDPSLIERFEKYLGKNEFPLGEMIDLDEAHGLEKLSFDEWIDARTELGYDKIKAGDMVNVIESIDIRQADEYGVLYCTKKYSDQVFSKRYGPILIELEPNPKKQPDSITALLAKSNLRIPSVNKAWIDPEQPNTINLLDLL